MGVARRCQSEGTFKRVFCEGEIETPEQFLELLKLPSNAPVFIFCGTKPIGFAWLNGFAGNIAFAHFCFLFEAWGKNADEAGRMVVDYWMTFAGLQVIIGTTPETNGPAANFAERIGFVRLGSIPRMVHNVNLKKNVAAIILYYVRP